MGNLKDGIYNWMVRKNDKVRYEYERYVMEHTIEHYEHRFVHWKILWKLTWHYRVKKKETPLLYFEQEKKDIQSMKINSILQEKENGGMKDYKKQLQTKVKKQEQSVVKKQPQTAVKQQPQNTEIHKNNKITLSSKSGRIEPFFFAKALLRYEVISFDIFDTLIFRPMRKPEDVFIFVGEKLGILDFPELRKSVEEKLRQKNKIEFGHHEVTLREIYKALEEKTGIPCEQGMKTEAEIEYELIYPNPYMKEVFDILKEQGKKIIAVSDMYLSKETISSFLKKGGYEVDDLFVSCEYYCNKRNGNLYRQVLEKYKGKKIVHIGDNHATDIVKATEMGLDTRFYRNCYYIGEETFNIGGMSELVGSVYMGLVNNTLFNGKNCFTPYFEYGYLYGGLYILGFCNWIKMQAENNSVTKILFLARDGYIYQKVFDMLGTNIDTEYVYWSRIVSVIANMESERYDFFKRLVDHKAVSVVETRIGDVLKIIGVTGKEIGLKKYNLDEDMILCTENKAYFEKVLRENYNFILKCNKNKLEHVENMLRHSIGEHKNVAVVDVGWTGSSVLAIKNLVENKYKMKCHVDCYLAASKVKGNVANLTYCMDGTLKTYMFSQVYNKNLYDYHVQANKGTNSIYFELFTQACMPSFKGIDKDGNFEFDIAEVENYQMIQEIHRGILCFAKQYLAIAANQPIIMNISGQDAYCPYKSVSSNLNYIKELFTDFSYARGVGGTGNMKIETIGEIIQNVKL